jgi:hypothetical protein
VVAVPRWSITTRPGVRWPGLLFDRRGWAIVIGLALLLALLGAAALVGSQLFWPTPARVGLAYGLDGDIFVADADGANAVRIADGRLETACGAFVANGGLVSPDGRYIAYRSGWSDTCPRIVYLTDAAGHPVASFPGTGWNIAWSPDSSRLATWFGEDFGVYGIDGVRQAVLDGSLMCCGDYDPIWSPDGADALIVKTSAGTAYEVPTDGTPARLIPSQDPRSWMARQGWSPGAVAYSPDDAHAAIIDGRSLVVLAADGSQRQVVVDAPLDPSVEMRPGSRVLWAPTGERIAYVVARDVRRNEVGLPVTQTFVVELVNPNTGRITDLATAPKLDQSIALIGFSPHGEWLLFSQVDELAQPSLWVANTDGSGARMLVDGTSDAGWLSLP